MPRGETQDPGAFWTGVDASPDGRPCESPCCIVRVVMTAHSVDVVGEAYLSEDLPSLTWTIDSISIGGDAAHAVREANRAARLHAARMPRIRVAAIHELELDDQAPARRR